MKEWRERMENLAEELKVTREMGRLNFPFQEDSRPLLSKIRPQFLVIAGVVAGVVIIGGIVRVIGGSNKKINIP